MTSSNGNIFRVTGPLCGEFTGRRWIPRGIHRSPVNSPHKGQWRGALLFPLICAWINDWVNNGEAGDLRRHRVHHDVIVMVLKEVWISSLFYSKGIDQQGMYRMYRLFHIQTEGSGGSWLNHLYYFTQIPLIKSHIHLYHPKMTFKSVGTMKKVSPKLGSS